MKRNYILFIIMSVLSVIVVVSGFFLWLALPQGGGYRGGSGPLAEATFLSWSKHSWTGLHDWVGVALLVIVVVHIVVHRKWILSVTNKLRRC